MLACSAVIFAGGCASVGLPGESDFAVQGRSIAIFVASTRKNERGTSNETVEDGARFSLQRISVPLSHEPGKVERPAFGSEDPGKHFAVASRRMLDETAFYAELASHVSGRVGSSRDVLLYVHGFNVSYDEARFRLAQIADDGRFGGVAVLYTWPSTNSLLDYGAAKENATLSRDALARLIHRLSEVPGVGRVHILAHSMGAWLTMEALRENAISGSPDLNGKLGDVMLAAPDIDLNVFRQQLARLDPNNPKDRAALDELGVKAYDLSAASTGLIGHGTYADAPQAVRTIGSQLTEQRPQDANVQAVLGERPVDSKIVTTPLTPLGNSGAAETSAGSASPVQ